VSHGMKIAICIIALTVIGVVSPYSAFGDAKDLGKHSQDQIKNACNAAGGDLLGVSELGSYGCEVPSKGTMVLCNKDGNCTGYTPLRTRTDRNKVLNVLGLKVKPVAEAQCCTGVDIGAKCVDEPKSGGCPADKPIRVIKP
jgi:hypothetical protein